jgi:ankyrin repeat protein
MRSPSAKKIEAFLTAAQTDDATKVREMLEGGMPVDVRGEYGRSALHQAALRGCLRTIQVLLMARLEKNARDKYGYTALHLVAEMDKADAAHVLVQAGLDVNAANGNRTTPLMLAALHEATQVAEVLLEGGAAVNARNEQGQTPLSLARSKRMKQLLRQAGANDKAAEPLPLKPVELLLQAAAEGDEARVRELLKVGAPADGSICYGRTPLSVAVGGGHVATARILLEAGANLHIRDDDGDKLLHRAAWSESVEMVRFLLEQGLDVNAANQDGFTPLMVAALQGQVEIVRVLLKARADRKVRGSFGPFKKKTAVEYARQVEDQQQQRALLKLLTGKSAAGDPVEAAFQEVASYRQAAEKPGFRKIVKLLSEVCAKPPKPWKNCAGVYACHGVKSTRLANRYRNDARLQETLQAAGSAPARSKMLLDRLQDEVRAAGFHLCEAEGDQDPRSAQFLLFPTANPYAVLAACQTNGANYGLSTHDLIAWFQQMEKENPFVLTACGHDFLAGEFIKPVVRANRLAKEMIRCCPDLIDGELVESAAQMAEHLENEQSFYFWWD